MSLDNLLTDGQAQPGTLIAFSGVEGLKHPGHRGAVHTRTAIAEGDPDLVSDGVLRHNRYGATTRHGMPGVDQHIEEDLSELICSPQTSGSSGGTSTVTVMASRCK